MLYQAVPAEARLEGLFGGLFVGERGWITSMSGSGPVEGGPEGILREMRLTTRGVNISANNHHTNWFECIHSRALPSAHEEIGHPSASLGQLVAINPDPIGYFGMVAGGGIEPPTRFNSNNMLVS